MAAFKILEKYTDPAAEKLSSYFSRLLMLVRRDRLDYCLLDSENDQFIALAGYQIPLTGGTGDQSNALRELIAEDNFLNRKYSSVIEGVESNFHTLVPAVFHDPGKIEAFLEFNFHLPPDLFYLSDHIEESQAYNLSGIPAGLQSFFNGTFENLVFVHASTALIKAAIYHNHELPGGMKLFLNIRGGELDIIAFEEKKLLLCNTFPWQTREDVLYFVMYVTGQLQAQPDRVQLYFLGMTEQEAGILPLLRQYIEEVAPAPRIHAFSYSGMFNSIPPQNFQDLFALALCGS